MILVSPVMTTFDISYEPADNLITTLISSWKKQLELPFDCPAVASIKEDGTQVRTVLRKNEDGVLVLGDFRTHRNILIKDIWLSSPEELMSCDAVFRKIELGKRFAEIFRHCQRIWDSVQSTLKDEISYVRMFSEAMLPGLSPCRLTVLEENPIRKNSIYLFHITAKCKDDTIHHFPLNSLLRLKIDNGLLVRPIYEDSSFSPKVLENILIWLRLNPGEEGVVVSIDTPSDEKNYSYIIKQGEYHESFINNLKEIPVGNHYVSQLISFLESSEKCPACNYQKQAM